MEMQMRGTTAVLNLYGPIGRGLGGIEADAVVNAISGTSAKKLEIHLNSEGGSYKDGMAMYNRIRSFKGPTHVIVDGAAWSAGSMVMLAGDTRELATGGRIMIHNAWLSVSGDHRELFQAAQELETLSADAAQLYSERTDMSVQDAALAMDRESWFGPEQAYKLGFTTVENSTAEFKAREYDPVMLGRCRAVPSEVTEQLAKFRDRVNGRKQTEAMDAFLAKHRLSDASA